MEDIFVPVCSVLDHIVSQPKDNCLNEALDLSISLRKVFCYRYHLYAKFCANCCENLDVNCGRLSVTSFVGVLNLTMHSSKKIVATLETAFFVIGLALANFKKRSAITAMYCLPLFVFGRTLRMSMAMNSSGSVAENNRGFCGCFHVCRLRAHDVQSLTVPYTLFTA